MRFTVVFESVNEDEDYSYGLVFAPTPIWVKGEEWLINMNQTGPEYKEGGIRQLINRELLSGKIENTCLILIHEKGYGTINDLEVLCNDLKREGFKIRICSM